MLITVLENKIRQLKEINRSHKCDTAKHIVEYEKLLRFLSAEKEATPVRRTYKHFRIKKFVVTRFNCVCPVCGETKKEWNKWHVEERSIDSVEVSCLACFRANRIFVIGKEWLLDYE